MHCGFVCAYFCYEHRVVPPFQNLLTLISCSRVISEPGFVNEHCQLSINVCQTVATAATDSLRLPPSVFTTHESKRRFDPVTTFSQSGLRVAEFSYRILEVEVLAFGHTYSTTRHRKKKLETRIPFCAVACSGIVL